MYRLLLSALLAACPMLVQAQATPAPLARCLADNTSGKDRKDLARWVFLGMAAHPEINEYASEGAATARPSADKRMADTMTRLLTVDCQTEARAAYQQGGANAIEVAFRTLGQLAMQEIMSNPNVTKAMAGFQRHLDNDRFRQVFGP